MPRPNVLRCSFAVVGFMVAAAAFADQPANTPVTSADPGIAAPSDLICRNQLRPGVAHQDEDLLDGRAVGCVVPAGIFSRARPIRGGSIITAVRARGARSAPLGPRLAVNGFTQR